VDDGRLRRDDRRDGEDRERDYKARAAARSWSKSGTASFSKLHAPRTSPS
jgi:hypothetical protein